MDNKKFRNAMGHFATGVTVVTIKSNEGKLMGFTANAFTSLSVEPPMILICIDKNATSMTAFKPNHPFAINILEKNKEDNCRLFSKKSDDKFKDVSYDSSEDGVPILKDNLATIECDVAGIIEGGDHYIVTGNVKNVIYDDRKEPLLFFRGELKNILEVKAVN